MRAQVDGQLLAQLRGEVQVVIQLDKFLKRIVGFRVDGQIGDIEYPVVHILLVELNEAIIEGAVVLAIGINALIASFYLDQQVVYIPLHIGALELDFPRLFNADFVIELKLSVGFGIVFPHLGTANLELEAVVVDLAFLVLDDHVSEYFKVC